MQRDWTVDGGLRSASEPHVAQLRRRAVMATRDVYRFLGLADFDDTWVEQAIDAAGSKDVTAADLMTPLDASRIIRQSKVTMVDVVAALDACGYTTEAERLLAMLHARVDGDYLHTAAIFDEDMNVMSLITDPNDYAGPGTGYSPSGARLAELNAVRQQRSVADLRDEQAAAASSNFAVIGASAQGSDPTEVTIGVSAATGRAIWTTLSGMSVVEVLDELLAGLEEEGCRGRIIRINDTVDLGMIGLTAARLSGSGIGIGLQAKGTALIHRRDLSPLANLELYSVAPTVTPELYRALGINAGRHAKGATPEPLRNPYSDMAIEARFHTKVVSLVAIERTCLHPELGPEDLELSR
jgi:propanediol dehydratase large subunit